MATCAACKTVILFGGVKDGARRFCSQRCAAAGELLRVADTIPADIVAQQAAVIHAGPCPACQGTGPVDFHISSRCMSFLVVTTRKATPHLMCRSCARSRIMTDTLVSFMLGWWGFPFGLIFTPATIASNIGAMAGGPKDAEPSPLLQQFAREHLARMVDAAAREPERA